MLESQVYLVFILISFFLIQKIETFAHLLFLLCKVFVRYYAFSKCMCVCRVFPLQLPLSSSHLDVYAGPGMKGPAIAMTSNSCPANLTIKRELSGAKDVTK